MKAIGLSVAMAVLTLCSTAKAEAPEVMRHADGVRSTVTVSPIELFSGQFNIEYEHALRDYFSLYGGLNFLAFRGVWAVDYDRAFAVGPEFGARAYLIGNAPAGLWVGPYVGLAYVSNTYNGSTVSSLGYGVGAMAGVNLLIKWFNLSLGAGTGWIDYSSVPSHDHRVGMYGFVPRLRLAVGVAF
jgi:hypothetical protein